MSGTRSNNEIIRRRSIGRNRRGQGAKSLTVKFQAGFDSVIVFAQCGHGIFCPMAWAGNSMCPSQDEQEIFMFSGCFKVMIVWQCGHGIF
jgi:hypothetical protein